MWNRQREAEEAREKLARVAEDPSAPSRTPPPIDDDLARATAAE
jgi:ATP-binding cassette subfamily B protein